MNECRTGYLGCFNDLGLGTDAYMLALNAYDGILDSDRDWWFYLNKRDS